MSQKKCKIWHLVMHQSNHRTPMVHLVLLVFAIQLLELCQVFCSATILRCHSDLQPGRLSEQLSHEWGKQNKMKTIPAIRFETKCLTQKRGREASRKKSKFTHHLTLQSSYSNQLEWKRLLMVKKMSSGLWDIGWSPVVSRGALWHSG